MGRRPASWKNTGFKMPRTKQFRPSKRLQPVTDRIAKEAAEAAEAAEIARLGLEEQSQPTEAIDNEVLDVEERGVAEVLDPSAQSSAWEERNRRAMRNWESILPALAAGLNKDKNTERLCTCTKLRTVTVFTDESCMQEQLLICNCAHWATTLVASGFFPGSPAEPSVVFKISLLRLAVLTINIGSLSKEAFAEGWRESLQEESLELVPSFYNQLREGLTFYSRARKLASEFPKGLTHLPELCPCCFSGQGSAVVVCLDGNFQHKRLRSRASKAAEPSELDSHIMLPDIKTRTARGRRSRQVEDSAGCSSVFKADQNQKKSAFFDETGLMLAVCRHDIPLRSVNIVRSGENYDYPIALLKSVMSDPACPDRIVVAYDVSCKFKSFACRVLSDDMFKRLEFVVPSFHIIAHEYTCHLQFHPKGNEHAGLSNGEGCERVWSGIRHLVVPNRYAQPSVRRDAIDNALWSFGERKRLQMRKWFGRSEKKAMSVISEAKTTLLDILGKTYEVSGEVKVIDEATLGEKIAVCREFYSNSTLRRRETLDPPFQKIFDAVDEVHHHNRNADKLAALVLEKHHSPEDWTWGVGVRWKQCQESVYRVLAWRLQRELWTHVSAKQLKFVALKSTTSGTRRAGVETKQLAKMGKKTLELADAYNSAVQSLNRFIGRVEVRPINVRSVQLLELDSPVWDLERAAPSMAWASDEKIWTGMLAYQSLKAAERELKQIHIERRRYSLFVASKIRELSQAAGAIDPLEQLRLRKVQSKLNTYMRLQAGEVQDVEELREEFLEAVVEALNINDDDEEEEEEDGDEDGVEVVHEI